MFYLFTLKKPQIDGLPEFGWSYSWNSIRLTLTFWFGIDFCNTVSNPQYWFSILLAQSHYFHGRFSVFWTFEGEFDVRYHFGSKLIEWWWLVFIYKTCTIRWLRMDSLKCAWPRCSLISRCIWCQSLGIVTPSLGAALCYGNQLVSYITVAVTNRSSQSH